ncbi:MAG: hypothetical protein AMXMBFR83_23220 [Phycisphaerae bacterium]
MCPPADDAKGIGPLRIPGSIATVYDGYLLVIVRVPTRAFAQNGYDFTTDWRWAPPPAPAARRFREPPKDCGIAESPDATFLLYPTRCFDTIKYGAFVRVVPVTTSMDKQEAMSPAAHRGSSVREERRGTIESVC